MNSLNIAPQSPSSAINFIDNANENQLKAMVAAKNGYSAIALSKLQAIRDAKMRQQAAQSAPPPLSEVIPQQLDQLENPSGIQGAMPPQMPPQQQMPAQQPMGIASIGGAPTGAGGGMVSFNGGGNVKHFALGELVPAEKRREMNYPSVIERMLNPSALSDYNARIRKYPTPESYLIGQPDYDPRAPLSEPPVNINPETGKKYSLEAPKLEPEQFQLSGPDSPSSTEKIADVAPPKVAPSKKIVTTGTSPKSGIAALSPEAQANQYYDLAKSYVGSLGSLTGDTAARKAAIGDVNAETAANIEAMKRAMPDRMQRFADEAAKDREGIEKEKEQIAPQALLVLASSLMNPSVRGGQGLSGFLASVGESVPKGLTEMQKLKSAVSDKLQKQKQLEMTIAAGQEARDRGMFDIASRQAQHAQGLRLDLVKSDNALLAQSYLAQSQLAMHQAEIPFKQATLELEKQKVGIMKLQAMKPGALQETINFGYAFAKQFNLNPQEILGRIVPGLGDSKADSVAKDLAVAAFRARIAADPLAASEVEIGTIYNKIRPTLFNITGKGEAGKIDDATALANAEAAKRGLK